MSDFIVMSEGKSTVLHIFACLLSLTFNCTIVTVLSNRLQDQYENISYHTLKGIEFLDKYGSFIKERCAIELEYASKLRRLVKNHHFKKKDEEDNQYSYIKAFLMMLQEIQDLAGQHEVVAENMMGSIVKEVSLLVRELKDERKRYLADGHKHQVTLSASLSHLDKAKKNYEKAYKEAEKAQESFQKADADLNLSRAEVEKARQFSNNKTQLCEESKTEYANHLQKANDLQRLHFNELMPKVFIQLQHMEERRTACVSNYIKQSAVIQRQVFPIVDKCLEGIIKAADSINPQNDSNLVIERYKSGNEPPEDIPFEDLSNPRPPSESGQGSTTLHYSNSISSKDTIRGTLSGAKFKSRKGLFGLGLFASNKSSTDDSKDDYSELPPSQRRKRIQQKIDSIQAQINQETAVRDGLMKMKVAYEQNSALGDPATVEGQLSENGHRMEKLQQELRKFQGYLSELNGKGTSPNSIRKSNRNSISEDSLSRSASDSSVGQPPHIKQSNESNLKINHNHCDEETTSNEDTQSNKNDGPLNVSRFNIPEAQYMDADEIDGEDDVMPALGKAKALYAFEAQSEGSITMSEAEEFEVVETDQGDGWTRVRRIDNATEEGFVPTSYIEYTLYD
ncbi:formin-binding protein 1-like protein [Leptotrombidium deliense]|uniref:Formin-binding protein 1-like protein n=1 Tax=Leptotrombidium deliense TaxID=299467 RepID=A0A443SLG1_9ACAR|nr:formin-binding protein 1-like protein [Leptotrombidium deliense]